MQPSFTDAGSSQPSQIPDSTPIQRACFVVAVVGIVGSTLASGFGAAGLNRTDGPSGNVFYYLFCANEPINLLVLILDSLFCLLWFRFDLFSSKNGVWLQDGLFRWGPVLVTTVGVLLITSAGTRWVFHSFPLSMDEYMADFQARIFAAGKMKSTIPPP